MRGLEMRRHAPRNRETDQLSAEGRTLAERVGRNLPGGYTEVFVSPARRSAETAAWFLRGLGQQLPHRHGVIEGLSSPVEDRWKAAAKASGTGKVDVIAAGDQDLVEEESLRMAGVARELLETVGEGGRALAVGHSPLIEAAVYGLTGNAIDPLGECEGVLLEDRDGEIVLAGEYRLEG